MELQAKVRIISSDKEILNEETGLVVKGNDILKQMNVNNMWKNDHEGKYATAMFDGQAFQFRIGQELILPLTVARHLRRMSAVCVGSDKLNGPLMPFLEIVETFDATRPKPIEVKSSPTTCLICGVDQETYPALMRHQMKEHSDLFKEEKKKIAWDTPKKTDPAPTSTDETWEGQ